MKQALLNRETLLAALGETAWLGLFGIALLTASVSSAQPSGDSGPSNQRASQQAEFLIQQEQLRQQRAFDQTLEKRARPGLSVEVEQTPLQASQSGGPCINVSDIELQGASMLNAFEKKRLLTPYIDQCLNMADLNRLLETVTNDYQSRGYITTRAVLPEQDLSSGTLLILVVEGTLEAWRFDTAEMGMERVGQVFPAKIGEVLNLRELEQGLDQFNRLQSFNTTIQLLPGERAGTSSVKVQNQRGRAWALNLSADNSGQRSTGKEQVSAQLGIDNPTGYADFVQLRLQRNVRRKGESGESESAAFHYDLPFGNWNLDINASLFRYRSRVDGASTVLENSGTSRSQSLRLSRLLGRDADSTDKVVFTVTRRDAQNFLEDLRLETSSRVLASAEFAWQRTGFFYRGRYTLGAAWHQGLDRLGTLTQSDAQGPDPLFRKQTLSASVFRQLTRREDWAFSYSSSLQLQRSSDQLFSSEQISIGGRYSVRGYEESSFSGNQGGYVRQDIRANNGHGWAANIGLDWGRVEDNFTGWEALTGMGFGLSKSWGKFVASAEYSQAINRSDTLNDDGRSVFFALNFQI